MEKQGLPPRYNLSGHLGAGGSGRVYRAFDYVRRVDLALKLVSPAESIWLRREFETLRQIRHENLVQVFDWGSLPNGESYYTMELVEGGDWDRGMDAPQSTSDVLRVLTGVLRGLAHLHSHGEVHGDLKPGNVLLGATSVRISDVGMGGSAGTTAQSGTPGYAAPEIWEGAAPNVQTDLYSVGVMAYEALAGRHPFAGKTIREVVSGQLAGWVPSLAALGITAPVELEQAIMRSLERNPSLREASADEFLQILDVTDPVGEILGGRFVSRASEAALAEEVLFPKSPAAPAVLYVAGAPGTGKTALVEDLLDRAVTRGASVTRTLGSAFSSLRGEREIPATAPDSAATDLGASEVAASLWDGAQVVPTVLCIELRSESSRDIDRIRGLGRYLSEYALETGEPCRVRIITEVHGSLPPTQGFERTITLEPFSKQETGLLVEGLLGRTQLEPAVMEWLHSSVGGVPGQLVSTITELIDQHLLTRRNGTWFFRDTGLLREFRPKGVSRWDTAWTHLPNHVKDILILLSFLDRGFDEPLLSRLCGSALDSLQGLKAKGWVVNDDGKWRVASEAVRRSVNALADTAATQRLREEFLQCSGDSLTREEKAVLLLGGGASGEVIDEGVWSSEVAMARGDFDAAIDRASTAFNLALQDGDHARLRKASLLLATALHRGGEDERAAKCLDDERVWDVKTNPCDAAVRLQVLGMIQRALGNMDQSRAYLREAIRKSESARDSRVLLQATAELAEIEWRYGDETTRKEAISRMRAALEPSSDRAGLDEERAAMYYQLGAALVVDGRQEEAVEVLQRGLRVPSGPYWKMRMSNALSSALYYMGDFNSALGQLDRAWELAEQGGIDSFRARILSNRAGDYYGLGKFRDAVDQHVLSARWARRTGNMFEYLVACTGLSINQIILARYEQAIAYSQEARTVAERLGNHSELAKNFELESLARFHMGDYELSWDLLKKGESVVEHFGFAEVKPRLLWQRARLTRHEGNLLEAERLLLEAETMLAETKDWEDLPGVQIDLQVVRFSGRALPSSMERVREISSEAGRTGALVVRLRGAIALSEMLTRSETSEGNDLASLNEALGSAEQSGALEFGWRLSFLLGELSMKRGDARAASSRYAHAVRGFREVAAQLSPQNRDLYLQTPQARALLARAA